LVRSEHPTPQLALMEQWCTVPTRILWFSGFAPCEDLFCLRARILLRSWPTRARPFKGTGWMRLALCGIAQVGPQRVCHPTFILDELFFFMELVYRPECEAVARFAFNLVGRESPVEAGLQRSRGHQALGSTVVQQWHPLGHSAPRLVHQTEQFERRGPHQSRMRLGPSTGMQCSLKWLATTLPDLVSKEKHVRAPAQSPWRCLRTTFHLLKFLRLRRSTREQLAGVRHLGLELPRFPRNSLSPGRTSRMRSQQSWQC